MSPSISKQTQSIVDIAVVWCIYYSKDKTCTNCFLSVIHLINKEIKPHKTATISDNLLNLQGNRKKKGRPS